MMCLYIFCLGSWAAGTKHGKLSDFPQLQGLLTAPELRVWGQDEVQQALHREKRRTSSGGLPWDWLPILSAPRLGELWFLFCLSTVSLCASMLKTEQQSGHTLRWHEIFWTCSTPAVRQSHILKCEVNTKDLVGTQCDIYNNHYSIGLIHSSWWIYSHIQVLHPKKGELVNIILLR